MKNLWRIAVLFFLPGCVLCAGSVTAFFRMADRGGELLSNVALIPLLWCSSMALSMYIVRYLNNRSPQLYYYGALIMAAAFAGGLGLIRCFALPGWIEGLAGTLISGAVMPFFIHGLSGESCRKPDRWSFIVGATAILYVISVMTIRERLIWLETLAFYLAEAVLVFWCFASPLTVYGTRPRRWVLRGILLAVAAGAFFVCPVLNYLPWNKQLTVFPEGAYQRTFITAQSSSFTWIDPADTTGFFSGAGNLQGWQECDQELLPAIPGLMALLPGSGQNNQIQLVVPGGSLLPERFSKVPGVKVNCLYLPESLSGAFNRGARSLWEPLFQVEPAVQVKYDLLYIGALPDNPYPGVVEYFWRHRSSGLQKNAVIAVRDNVLQNKTLQKILLRDYIYCGILPVPGDIHIFAGRELALTPESLDSELAQKWAALFPSGIYLILCKYPESPVKPLPGVAHNNVKMGGNSFWHGIWWWVVTLALVAVWRILRVASERHQQRYRWWKSVENGFGGMGVILMSLGLLTVNCGILSLGIAGLALSVILLLGQVRSGGGWVAVAGVLLLLLPAALCHRGIYNLLLIPVMLQAMLYCGNLQYKAAPDYSPMRQYQLWCACAIGMWLAAAVMAVVWYCNVPLGCVWLLILLTRLPGIWQNGNMRVY